MRRKLKKPCPECGGTPWVIRFCENRLDYMQYVSCVYCPDCGAKTHMHESEDDAINEFYFATPEAVVEHEEEPVQEQEKEQEDEDSL